VTAPPPEQNPASYLVLYRCRVCREPVGRHSTASGCEWSGLTPLLAWTLVASLEILGDQWTSVPSELDVPPCAQRFTLDPAFCERMKRSAHYLAEQLASGRSDAVIARCTADEVNLAMALSDTQWILEVNGPVPSALIEASVGGLESDAGAASDSLFNDHDVLMLWNPMLDGIENDLETLAHLGTADLHPSRWFEPFLHVKEPID
jgi:hypothetical protein